MPLTRRHSVIDRWVIVKPYHLILRLVARISARVFLGHPLCRNEQWLEISTEFTENGLLSMLIASAELLLTIAQYLFPWWF